MIFFGYNFGRPAHQLNKLVWCCYTRWMERGLKHGVAKYLLLLVSLQKVQSSHWAKSPMFGSIQFISNLRLILLPFFLFIQANRFVTRFHEERKTKLRYTHTHTSLASFVVIRNTWLYVEALTFSLILDNERWKQTDVPPEFQELVDHISTSGQYMEISQ